MQEVLAEFKGEVPVNENLNMKIYLAVLVAFQLSELACYAVLYTHVNNHNKEMLQASVITSEIYLVNSSCLKHTKLAKQNAQPGAHFINKFRQSKCYFCGILSTTFWRLKCKFWCVF